jgi:DNA-directed RNA polymerase specialized sigma24 family protein
MQILTMVIDELLADLSETQQQIVQLRIEGNTIGQIADETGRSRRTVERVMQEFRQRLSELIDGDDVSTGESDDDRNQSNQ